MDLGSDHLLQGARPPGGPASLEASPSNTKPLQTVQCCTHDVTVKAEGVSVDDVHLKFREYAKRYVFQLERGDGGYVHYQCRVSLHKKRRSGEIAKLVNDDIFKSYWTPTSNNARDKEAFYCIKADTRVDGPWKESDYQPPIVYTKQMSEFAAYARYPWQSKVEKWCTEWDKRTIYWVYDEVGCNGKSDLVEWLDVNRIASVVPPMRSLEDIMQFCMSYPAKAYLIDFPRAMKKEYLCDFYAGIESLKNGMLYDKRYKGQKKWQDRPAIVIFSNTQPDTFAMSKDRWSIWTIEKHDLKPLNDLAKTTAAAAAARGEAPVPVQRAGGAEGASSMRTPADLLPESVETDYFDWDPNEEPPCD